MSATDADAGTAGAVVVLGGGHGGTQAADALRRFGWTGPVTIVDADPWQPYQRPPLSKGLLDDARDDLCFHEPEHYADESIDLVLGDGAVEVDRERREVRLASGRALGYDHLVLGLGSVARPVPFDTGGLDGVGALRTRQDADALRRWAFEARSAVLVGAGFIGLELATQLRGIGLDVTVVETAPGLLSAALSDVTADFLRRRHESDGVRLVFGARVVEAEGRDGRVRRVRLDTGEVLPADLVVVGVGAVPNDGLAAASGLVVDDGVVVDHDFRTSDPAIFAIGDCARFPGATGLARLTSVQHAFDSGTRVAKVLAGRAAGPAPVPWFWTDQAGVKVQMAGAVGGHDRVEVLGSLEDARFSVRRYAGDALVGGESVGWPQEHLATRRELAAVPAPA